MIEDININEFNEIKNEETFNKETISNKKSDTKENKYRER